MLDNSPEIIVHSVNKFCVVFSNVDVFSPDKIREIRHRIQDSSIKHHVIALQEVRPKNYRFERQLVEYSIEGYDILEKNVTDAKEGRGLLIYVRNEVSYSELTLKQEYCEYLSIEIKGMEDTLVIVTVYRSPNNNSTGNDNLLKLLNEVNDYRAKYKLIIGDLNLPNIDWERCTTTTGCNSFEFRFIETFRDCYLTQHVKEVTRMRGETRQSNLDLMISNEEEIVNDIRVESPLGRSDHAYITFTCDIGIEEKPQRKTVYLFEKADYELMRQKLNINWKEYLGEGSIEEKWRRFLRKINEIIKECVPIKVINEKTKTKKRTNKELPINRKLWTKIKRKKRLWARIKVLDSRSHINDREYQEVNKEYRQANNQVRNETRKAIKNKERNIARYIKENPKLFWKYVGEKCSEGPEFQSCLLMKRKQIKRNLIKRRLKYLQNILAKCLRMNQKGECLLSPTRKCRKCRL